MIGAAIGITMTRYAMTYRDASVLLQDLARHHRRRLLDLARAITTSRWPVAEAFDRARDGSPVARVDVAATESTAGRLLDLMVETPDLGDLLVAVAGLAVESIPGCASASITVIRDGSATTVASSDARAAGLDELQYSNGRGPCLRAAHTDEVVEIHHLASTSPIDPWQRAAVEAGIHAVLSLPIASDANIAAALNLYATSADPWPSAAQSVAEDLAVYTGDALTLAYRHDDPIAPQKRL